MAFEGLKLGQTLAFMTSALEPRSEPFQVSSLIDQMPMASTETPGNPVFLSQPALNDFHVKPLVSYFEF